MGTIGIILMVLGGLLAFGAWIWLLILAFKDSALWGIIVLFLSWLGSLIFTIVRKPAPGWKPFLYMVLGGVLVAVGSILASAGATTTTTEPSSMLIDLIKNLG